MPEPGTWAARTVRFARMAGTSTAAPDAAPWVTDFLNAAYYARGRDERSVDDLRLAFTILTTRWWAAGGRRRLRLTDLPRFHRAFGRSRISPRGGFGRLTRDDLLAGAGRLLGPGFAAAYADPARRGWGIVFPTAADRAAYRPARRLDAVRLGAMTPPAGDDAALVWQSYRPVPVPDPERTLARLLAPERWPDFASDHGRFTPLRPGGLAGQTFEIEVVAGAATRRPLITRGYVTATGLRGRSRPRELAGAIDRLDAGLGEAVVPPGHGAMAVVELTTHAGHFIGPAVSTLVLTTSPGGGTLRDVGRWEPMAFPQRTAYRLGGRDAQHAFWGEGEDANSMLHQLAAPDGPAR